MENLARETPLNFTEAASGETKKLSKYNDYLQKCYVLMLEEREVTVAPQEKLTEDIVQKQPNHCIQNLQY